MAGTKTDRQKDFIKKAGQTNLRGHVAVTQHKAQQPDKDKGRDVDYKVDNKETLVKNIRTGTGNHDRKSKDPKNGG